MSKAKLDLRPIMTIADLEAMGPSRALRKAAEAYPGVGYDWMQGLTQRMNEAHVACPACLLSVATGTNGIYDEFEANIQIPGAEPQSTFGEALSHFAGFHGCRSFEDVADRLEEVGL